MVVPEKYWGMWENTAYAKYHIGDVLWVREAWQCVGYCRDDMTVEIKYQGGLKCVAEVKFSERDRFDRCIKNAPKIKLARFMFREASRIDLEVTDVRVERLQDITEKDAKAEGVVLCCANCPLHSASISEECIKWQNNEKYPCGGSFKTAFSVFWDTLAEKGVNGWESNPWVWVYEFRRVAA
jgi:hypothetical protein